MTLRRLIVWSLTLSGTFALLLLLFCPRPELYGDIGFSSAVEDRNGALLRLTLADDERYRLRISLDDIAPTAVDATLLYEDRHFFSHPGFNPGALFRAAWATYARRERIMGGSTISMQLARLRFGLDTRSIGGKLVQIGRAIQLERHFDKREILEAYLNLAPYGGNIEGIGTASLVYFSKPASELSIPEALALAVIPQNPTRRNPSSAHGYIEIATARSRLLRQWHDTYGESEELRQQSALPLTMRSVADLPFEAAHFVQHLVDKQTHNGVYRSTLDLSTQRLLETSITDHVARFQHVGIRNASAMLVDSRSMQLLASVGSADYFDIDIQGQVDGTRAKRSPGSTLKPFVYGIAMDEGLIHPMTLLKDAPTRFAAYTPENFDRGFMGPVFARDALIYSRNVPAIDLLSRIGHRDFHRFLLEGSVANLKEADYYGLAAVLGGVELTMQEIVSLYAMLANKGMQKPIQALLHATASSQTRLLSAESSFLILDILRQNPRPNALRVAAYSGAPSIAWKTGTSYAFRDAWSVGVFGPYVLAVWVGNFDGSGNPSFVGREAAAPLFFSIADAVIASSAEPIGIPEPGPEMNLRKVPVCARSGDLPGRYCPRTSLSWFIPGVSPIRVSTVHRAIRIDKRTGFRACNPDDKDTYAEVYEFWPTDVSRLFQQAGIAIRKPPPWSDECSMEILAASGSAPRINSLSESLIYQLRSGPERPDTLALTATADADARWLYWFVADQFVGKADVGETLLWKPVAGRHRVLTVDDLGRSDAVEIRVATTN